jgi:glycosyltransferase involved in cell wall biosynthesis
MAGEHESLNTSEDRLPRSVLFVSGISGEKTNTQRYRCAHAQEQLALHGIQSVLRHHTDHAVLADALECDLCVLHRVPFTELGGDLVGLLHRQGKAAVYDTDDLVFDPGVTDQIRFFDSLAPATARQYRRDVERNRRMLLACDRVWVPTRYLAQAVEALGRPVSVHRNALSAEFLRLAQEVYTRKAASRRVRLSPVVIGYASGTRSHDRDFREAAGALLHLLEKYDDVHLHILGHLSLDERFDAWAHRIRRTPYRPWQEIPAVVSEFDINLAPLEQGNPFCQGKSELKYLHAGAVGVPTVASRTDAFEYAIRHGENGFLAGSDGEWLEALKRLVIDADARRAMGARAREHVLRHYTPEARAESLIDLLADLWRERPAPSASVEIRAEVIGLQRKHLARQREALAGMTRQAAAQRERARRAEAQRAELEQELADWRRLWTSQLEGAVAARRRWAMAQAIARMKTAVKRWLGRAPKIMLNGRIASPGPELTAGRCMGQTFVSAENGLCRIEVLFATFGRINTGRVILSLRADPAAVQDLRTVQVRAAALRDNEYHHFDFEPLPDSAGRSLYFCLEAPEAVPGDAVSAWVFEDAGPRGWRRYAGAKPVGGQIVFLARYFDDVDRGEALL